MHSEVNTIIIVLNQIDKLIKKSNYTKEECICITDKLNEVLAAINKK